MIAEHRSNRLTNLYFIRAVSGGPVKIGVTKRDPKFRLSALQTGHHEPLRIFLIIKDCHLNLEKQLKKHYRASRIRGEWFKEEIVNNEIELMDTIKKYCTLPMSEKDKKQAALDSIVHEEYKSRYNEMPVEMDKATEELISYWCKNKVFKKRKISEDQESAVNSMCCVAMSKAWGNDPKNDERHKKDALRMVKKIIWQHVD